MTERQKCHVDIEHKYARLIGCCILLAYGLMIATGVLIFLI